MNARSPAITISATSVAGHQSVIAQRLLNIVLFITLLTSFLAFIEPSPHDVLMLVLAAICVAARVPFDRKLLPLLLLLIAWLTGGLLALIQVGDNAKDIQYAGTSVYLCVAALIFACLFSSGDLVRLNTMRVAYTIAAICATAAGYIGFFHLLPGSDIFLVNERVSATFKDPNVFGPFLILPMLFLIIDTLTRGLRLGGMIILTFLLGGLFLSFSRGAWLHFAISAFVAFAILVVSAREPRHRARIVLFGLGAVAGMAILVIGLISIGSIHDLFVERAQAIQSYDVGPGGRFWLQQLSLRMILENPFGLGPFEFDRMYGSQQHNVYLQGFLVYGWLGGMIYLSLIMVTFFIGLRPTLVQTPWQKFTIAAYAGFVGDAIEGAIVDTDHWRHFFLLLGLVWGLTAATVNYRRRQSRMDYLQQA